MLILVLEASTSSAKAMLYSAKEGVLALRTLPYDPSYSDVKTQEADRVFDALVSLGRELAQGRDIAAVAVSGTWHNILICDRNLRLKSRAYSWTYTDAAPKAAEIRRDHALSMELYQRTGCMPNVTYPSYRLMYLREQGVRPGPEDMVFGQGTYIFARLTGEILESRSMASASGLLNIHSLTWDERVAELTGVKTSQMPRLVGHTDVRPLTAEAAALLGVPAGIPVVPAHPDGALNQVGAGAMRPSVMTLSVGTSGAMRLTSDRPVVPDQPGTWCYYAPGKWLAGAATANCTNCVDWFTKTVLKGQFTFPQLEGYLREETAQPPLFLPFLFGERCPGWDDTRTGGFLELTGFHGLGALYRSVLEGVAFSLYQCYQILEELCGAPAEIRLSGGILKSELWTQLLCDVFQREMAVSQTEQASMLGAACLGLMAAGAITSFDQFDARVDRVIPPRPNAGLRERYGRYLEAYQKNREAQ